MAPKCAVDSDRSAAAASTGSNSHPKRCRVLTQKALDGDELPRGATSQPIELPKTQPDAPPPPLLSNIPAKVAVNLLVGQVIGAPKRPWELQLLESQPAIAASAVASKAVTVTTVEEDSGEELSGFDARFVDDFEGINWSKLRRFEKPLRTLTGKKSWVFKHSYRVALQRTSAEVSAGQSERTYFVCR
jgi:hypothetical protein